MSERPLPINQRLIRRLPSVTHLPEESPLRILTERNMCGISTLATCLNDMLERRFIDYEVIPDILSTLYTFHEQPLEDTEGRRYERWEVFTPNGYIRHQALVATARGFGVEAEALNNCPMPVLVNLLQEEARVSLSVFNDFIIDCTDPDANLNPGTHFISLLGMTDRGEDPVITIADPYANPQQPDTAFMDLPLSTIQQYVSTGDPNSWRGVVYATNTATVSAVEAFRTPNTLYPTAVIQAIRDTIHVRS